MRQVAAAVKRLDVHKRREKAKQIAQVDGIAKELDKHIEKLKSLVDGLKVRPRAIFSSSKEQYF